MGEELRDALSRNLSQSEEIFSKLQKNINNNDINEKISTIIIYIKKVV